MKDSMKVTGIVVRLSRGDQQGDITIRSSDNGTEIDLDLMICPLTIPELKALTQYIDSIYVPDTIYDPADEEEQEEIC